MQTFADPSSAVAPIADIRANFPALDRHHAGHPVAYFDGPGGTQVPRQVVDAMVDYLINHNANTHWAYPTSAESDLIIANARETLAHFLNAAADEIAFGANMTTLTFHVSRGLGREWGPGDEVIVTELDHHANVAPWTALAVERGVTIRTVPLVPATGQLDMAALESMITGKTRLVAVGAASNALGTINDIPRITSMAHKAGALVFVDAVHYAPHERVDVRAWDCDFLACSAYKFYGPHIGVLYGKKDLLEKVKFAKLLPAPDTAPENAETGTQNHEGIAGAAAAVDFLANLAQGDTRRTRLQNAFAVLHRRGMELVEHLWNGLAEINGVTLFGPDPTQPRTPTVSFTVKGVASEEVSRRLVARGVFASSGNFYAMTVVQRLDQYEHGLVRAGCACYATAEEVNRLVDGVREIAQG
jgi:cysteine desulfurase family protein (TIGR01976 family)